MGQISEAEISMVLDTYMYLNYQQAAEGDHISHILTELEKLPDYQPGGRYYGEYTIIKQAAENEQIGNLTISCQSAAMGYDPGTAACTFSAPDQSTVYVVYRGTGDGEWPDNGIGMSSTATIQQNRALAYFEEVVERMGLTGNQHLVITGHSKGGNKAQFVTMESRYQDLVDACYSVDGQGFSPEAVNRWKEKYGEEGYEEKTRKIKGIYGENDYVSALGLSIIPKGSIRYIRTPVEKSNFAGYHDIKYLFADWEKTSGKEIVYTGRKNQDAPGRGILGNYAAALSAWVMSLPVQKRDGCAAVVMQAMESMQGRKDGINGEKLTMSDVSDFAFLGIPLIAGNLILGQEGKELIEAVVGKESFVCQVPGNLYLCVDIPALSNCAFKLEQEMGRIAEMKEQILKAAQAVPVYMKGWIGLHRKINLAAGVLGRLEKQLGQLLEIQRQISHSYKKWEEDAMEIAALSIDFCEKNPVKSKYNSKKKVLIEIREVEHGKRNAGNSDQITRDYFDSLLLEMRHLDGKKPDTTLELYGERFQTPIMTAALSHLDKVRDNGMVEMARGAFLAGAVNWAGMGDKQELEAIVATGARTIKIIKPYADHDMILDRIAHAEKCGALAVGMDIDHAFDAKGNFDRILGYDMSPKTQKDICSFVKATSLPFIVKGVLSGQDAYKCLMAGVKGIVVSHHHGIMDYAVPPLRMLPEIVKVVQGQIPVFVDCGIISGMDAYKALALGAAAVCAGRVVMEPLGKNGAEGVRDQILGMNEELKGVMARTGCGDLGSMDPSVIVPT